ncbi:chromobox -like protein [Brachionus plicatilis]|uniref:Chromobox-like protein n=1 Tax=Brachionus plicatilis TaxID=10195 RepID=A0A3M7QVU9_BRAPC|nr:chromobox -like protein [Brachionus plicatilis]
MSSRKSSSSKKVEIDQVQTLGQTETQGDEPEYEVETVMAKKVIDGHVFYQIKWKGYDEITWEPVEHCNCHDLIKKFEKKLKEEKKSKKKSTAANSSDSDSEEEISENVKVFFTKEYIDNLLSKNLKPEKILGVTDEPGELTFLIKWKNQPEPDLVPSRVANKYYSKYVIKFYEQRLVFNR